jgi:hypothetical protein
VFFESANKLVFTKRERTEIYDSIMEKVEKILSAMKQPTQAIRELAWRIALESWLRSEGDPIALYGLPFDALFL